MLGKTFAEKQIEQRGRDYDADTQRLRRRIADLERRLDAYRKLYDLWGKDDETDASFAAAYECVRLADVATE